MIDRNDVTDDYKYILKDIAKFYKCSFRRIYIYEGNGDDDIYINDIWISTVTDFLNEEKLKKHLEYDNPFKSDNFNNPGKDLIESLKILKSKAKRISREEYKDITGE